MLLVFVSAPYRALDGRTADENQAVARELVIAINRTGKAIGIASHTNSQGMWGIEHENGGALLADYWCAAYRRVLSRCDVVLMESRWRESEGCRIELQAALQAGMTVYYDRDTLLENIRRDQLC